MIAASPAASRIATAPREAKEANPFHIVMSVGRSMKTDRSGMIDGGGDKASVGKHLRDIMMTNEGTAPAVGDDNKRQLLTVNRTILHPGHGGVAEIDLPRRFGAGRPHCSS